MPDYLKKNVQVYTGLENEEEIVKKAAIPGMVTLTTSAIGRNTDILYNKKLGMDVLHGCLDSVRRDRQKSGRTGRQGSPGSVYYILNKSDLSNPYKAISELQQHMDNQGKTERGLNEEFYDLLNYLFDRLEDAVDKESTKKTKSALIKSEWSKFLLELET